MLATIYATQHGQRDRHSLAISLPTHYLLYPVQYSWEAVEKGEGKNHGRQPTRSLALAHPIAVVAPPPLPPPHFRPLFFFFFFLLLQWYGAAAAAAYRLKGNNSESEPYPFTHLVWLTQSPLWPHDDKFIQSLLDLLSAPAAAANGKPNLNNSMQCYCVLPPCVFPIVNKVFFVCDWIWNTKNDGVINPARHDDCVLYKWVQDNVNISNTQ